MNLNTDVSALIVTPVLGDEVEELTRTFSHTVFNSETGKRRLECINETDFIPKAFVFVRGRLNEEDWEFLSLFSLRHLLLQSVGVASDEQVSSTGS